MSTQNQELVGQTAPASDVSRLLLAVVALMAADRDDRASDRPTRSSEVILAGAGLSIPAIAAVTGKNREAVRSTLRRRSKPSRPGEGANG